MNECRLANIEDLEKITEIYNQAISSKFATADTIEFKSEERLEWFNSHRQDTESQNTIRNYT